MRSVSALVSETKMCDALSIGVNSAIVR
ncbi:MAG: hypothetical protein RLZZ06_823, partial [Actinomycetota bacterium]